MDNGRVIVTGDTNQSIYDNTAPPEKIPEILHTTDYPLNRIYRISRRIRDISADFCAEREKYLAAQVMDYNAEIAPNLIKANDIAEERKWLWLSAKTYRDAGYVPAILISNHESITFLIQSILSMNNKSALRDEWLGRNSRGQYDYSKNKYDLINNYLQNNGLKLQYLGNNYGSFEKAHSDNLISIMTYHSAKGLDFKTIFVPFLSSNYTIWRDANRSRTLFFVALTRSREQLILSYSLYKHPYLTTHAMQAGCTELNASDEIQRMENPFGEIEDDEDVPILI